MTNVCKFFTSWTPLDILIHHLKRIECTILGLCETRWTGKREINKDGVKTIYAGGDENRHQEEVGIIIRKEETKVLIGYKAISARIAEARFDINYGEMAVIQVYAPALRASEEELEEF